MPDTNSNSYTLIYAGVMTLIFAIALAAAATGLKPIQQQAIDFDKKRSILNAVTNLTDKQQILKEYAERVTEVVIDQQGNAVEGVKAFDLVLKKEYKKTEADRRLPLYVYNAPEGKKYIIPMHGAGLWDEIWGYISLDQDLNTIKGASFDHKGETPGLGAEITTPKFQDQFEGKKLTEGDQFKFKVLKGVNPSTKTNAYAVDGISGATITGNGVNSMIEKSYNSYNTYFQKVRGNGTSNNTPPTPTPEQDNSNSNTGEQKIEKK